MRILLIFAFFLSFTTVSFAQIPDISEAEVRNQLEKRNIDEEELRRRLLERGFDIDNLDPTNLVQLQEFEVVLREVVAEMEAENAEEEKRLKDQELMQKERDKYEGDIRESGNDYGKDTKNARDKEEEDDDYDDDDEENDDDEDDEDDDEDDGDEDEEDEDDEDDAEDEMEPAEVFGQHIFRDKSIKLYKTSKNVKPTTNYILGVGDEIGISIFGDSQASFTFEINDEGFILPPDSKPIFIKGLTYGESKKVLRKAFGKNYRFESNEFKVTLNFSRTISIDIVGEVMNSGNFSLPAVNNVFNALVAAGGPSNIGSLRNIQIIRDGVAPIKVDIYKYLMNPTEQPNLHLVENDAIYIPVAESVVSLDGLVNRPFKYELKKGEGLVDLVSFAGGLEKAAFQGKVQIKRYVDDQEKIFDVNYRNLIETNTDYELINGDEIFVLKIPKPYDNFVEIEGPVEIEGKYALKENMKITDLIDRTRLLKGARGDVSFLRRTNEDMSIKYIRVNITDIIENENSPNNILLQAKDKLIIFEQSSFVDKASIVIGGSVRHPNKFDYDNNQNIKVEDAIIMTGGLTKDAADVAYIYRIDPQRENSVEYVRINIREALANPTSKDNKWLESNDSLVVFSKDYFRDNTNVRVTGAVRYPGIYPYDISLGLKDLLTLAGGLQIVASKSKIDVYRLEFRGDQETRTIAATVGIDDDYNVVDEDGEMFELRPFDNIVVRNAPEFEMQKMVVIRGEVKYPGEYALLNDNETVTSIVNRAGGLTTEAFAQGATLNRKYNGMGYVIMELDEAIKNKRSRFNYIMKANDEIEIPKKKDLVSIIGETQVSEYYPDKIANTGRINVAYDKGKNALYYVTKYSGISENGKRRLITVEHPNGQVERTKNFLLFRKYPKVQKGSTIMIGNALVQDEKNENDEDKKKVDWGDVFSSSIAQATSILSLILLIQRVN